MIACCAGLVRLWICSIGCEGPRVADALAVKRACEVRGVGGSGGQRGGGDYSCDEVRGIGCAQVGVGRVAQQLGLDRAAVAVRQRKRGHVQDAAFVRLNGYGVAVGRAVVLGDGVGRFIPTSCGHACGVVLGPGRIWRGGRALAWADAHVHDHVAARVGAEADLVNAVSQHGHAVIDGGHERIDKQVAVICRLTVNHDFYG